MIGKTSVEEAGKVCGQNVIDRTLGKAPPYTIAHQFKPTGSQAAADIEVFGPQLGRPRVDTLNGSRHKNMKEFRRRGWRLAFRVCI